jgi:hypothetical protein
MYFENYVSSEDAEDLLQELAILLCDAMKENKIAHPNYMWAWCGSVAKRLASPAGASPPRATKGTGHSRGG